MRRGEALEFSDTRKAALNGLAQLSSIFPEVRTVKRIVLAVVTALTLVTNSLPAAAEDGRYGAAAVGAIGGLALGAVLGSALAAPRPVYAAPSPAPRPVYVEPTYADEEECYVQRERVWVPGWGWELRRRTICN